MSGPTLQEHAAATAWTTDAFGLPLAQAVVQWPVSFRYAGQAAATLLPTWRAERASSNGDGSVTRDTLTLTDPHSGLECRLDVLRYADFPAVEWVTYFRNTSATETAIIEDIQALDAVFPATRDHMCWVHRAKGSQCHLDDFAPLPAQLTPRSEVSLSALSGRSSDGALPFFNLEWEGAGVIGAIGWTGSWMATFRRSADGNIAMRAGMSATHLKLLPGEQIRTPRILLLLWEQDRLHGHNMLRQLILNHHTPRPDGVQLQAPICDTHWGDRRDAHQIAAARWLKQHELPIEYFWIDADWYGDAPHNEASDTFGVEWQRQVGNWFPRPGAYPNGLKPVGDALQQLGMKFLLWVEPERVYRDTQIAREHPEWLLGPIGDNYLFNLGIPAARAYLTQTISDLIDDGGIGCYRQDFNMQPAPFWSAADAPDRVGMAEIRHVEGLYAFWDELLARHPGLIIDNCASGGRRIDLETTSRSIPLWRSDVQCYPGFATTAMQNQTFGLAPWIPLSTGCAPDAGDTYAFRSALGPGIVVSWSEAGLVQGADFPVAWCRKMLAELKAVRPYFVGDFYPLVSYSLAEDAWAVWQFDRPDLGEGMVLALRRPASPFPRIEAALQGLDPAAQYELHSVDNDFELRRSGRALLERGFAIELVERPGSMLVVYKRVA